LLAEWTGNLGQDLFYPPNVFGWPGGRSWLTSRALIGRANFATSIARGALHNPTKPFDPVEFALRHDQTRENLGSFYGALLVGEANAIAGQDPSTQTPEQLLASILNSPKAQLG
jgi:uncharacterized protein (DUF1800 family)